jgi:hypothetical protein
MLSASNSLIIRENTGNFRDFDPLEAGLRPKKLCLLCGFCRIPYSTDQGILKREQGIISEEQGIFFEHQGNLYGPNVEKNLGLIAAFRNPGQVARVATTNGFSGRNETTP